MNELIVGLFEPEYFFSTGIWFLLSGAVVGFVLGTVAIALIERRK